MFVPLSLLNKFCVYVLVCFLCDGHKSSFLSVPATPSLLSLHCVGAWQAKSISQSKMARIRWKSRRSRPQIGKLTKSGFLKSNRRLQRVFQHGLVVRHWASLSHPLLWSLWRSDWWCWNSQTWWRRQRQIWRHDVTDDIEWRVEMTVASSQSAYRHSFRLVRAGRKVVPHKALSDRFHGTETYWQCILVHGVRR